MKNLTTIFLDLDDVLADCTGDALRHFGCDYKGWWDYPIKTRDIYQVLEQLTHGVYLPPQVFWEHFKREFWATMNPLEGCHELVDYCAGLVGPENVVILTTPTKCGDCLAGKLDWIEDNMPKWMHRQYIMTPRKHFCAAPNTLLVDDADENCDRFMVDSEGIVTGARAFRWPQPWNQFRGQCMNRLPFLKWFLGEISTPELANETARAMLKLEGRDK